ncbi:hypothetical protein T310_8658, partial [Rasamsonia emersonii CBS 393.64]
QRNSSPLIFIFIFIFISPHKWAASLRSNIPFYIYHHLCFLSHPTTTTATAATSQLYIVSAYHMNCIACRIKNWQCGISIHVHIHTCTVHN